ncbi:hypothetical protein J32TS2_00530 [Shouchella clausii]|nr:hypothetical protein J32TS2_00530 [Shouchella clausii]
MDKILDHQDKISDHNREDYECLLFVVVICSAITFRKIKKLERYKAKLKKQLYI